MSSRARTCLTFSLGCATVVVLGLIVAVVALRVTFKSYRQVASSMEPTVSKGDVVMTRPAGRIERGDLIVFRNPMDRSVYFKRVIGLPGDVVELRDSGAIVNGIALHEPYIMRDPGVRAIRDVPAMTVPPDSYYFLGDNRDNSNDSRFFGPVKREDILGKAVLIVSPENGVWRP